MKNRKWVAVSCTHGNLIDKEAEKKFFDFIADYKPEVRIHLGDAFEFTCLRKGINSEDGDYAADLDADFEEGKAFLSKFFRGKEHHFIRGNHDERLWQLRDSTSGLKKDYAERGIAEIECHLKKFKAKMLPYSNRGVLTINGLHFTHGVSHAIAAGRKMGTAYGSVVFGHTHRPELSWVERYPSPVKVVNTGCLRTLDAGFASRNISNLAWGHGCAYGEFIGNNDFTLNLQLL